MAVDERYTPFERHQDYIDEDKWTDLDLIDRHNFLLDELNTIDIYTARQLGQIALDDDCVVFEIECRWKDIANSNPDK